MLRAAIHTNSVRDCGFWFRLLHLSNIDVVPGPTMLVPLLPGESSEGPQFTFLNLIIKLFHSTPLDQSALQLFHALAGLGTVLISFPTYVLKGCAATHFFLFLSRCNLLRIISGSVFSLNQKTVHTNLALLAVLAGLA